MTSRRPTLTLAATTLLAACASGPSGPRPYDPVGDYEFALVAEGQTIRGTMTIEGDVDGYSGTLRAVTISMRPAPITSVEVVDQTVTMTATIFVDGPGRALTIALTVTDTGLQGTWAMSEGSGTFTAVRSN